MKAIRCHLKVDEEIDNLRTASRGAAERMRIATKVPTMGREKERLIQEEDDWQEIAIAKGYICSLCGNVIPKSEYESGETECGWCRHQSAKDN